MSDQQEQPFFDKLEARVADSNSHLCIGLDPHPNEICPPDQQWSDLLEEERCAHAYTFCKNIIDATGTFHNNNKYDISMFYSLFFKRSHVD